MGPKLIKQDGQDLIFLDPNTKEERFKIKNGFAGDKFKDESFDYKKFYKKIKRELRSYSEVKLRDVGKELGLTLWQRIRLDLLFLRDNIKEWFRIKKGVLEYKLVIKRAKQ